MGLKKSLNLSFKVLKHVTCLISWGSELKSLGSVVRSLVSANRWLRGIKTYRFPWYLTLVSANHALSNPGLEAATANALSPSVFLVLPLYGSSSISLFRRSKYLLGHKMLTKLLMLLGDRPLIALKTKINILNCTLCFMGSQWRERSNGVMWENFAVPVISRVAAFWTRWSLFKEFGRPHSKLLSNRVDYCWTNRWHYNPHGNSKNKRQVTSRTMYFHWH